MVRKFPQRAPQHLIVAKKLSDRTAEFIARLPERAKTHIAREHGTVRLFLEHPDTGRRQQRPLLIEIARVSGRDSQRYEDYLRRDRSTHNSVHVYMRSS